MCISNHYSSELNMYAQERHTFFYKLHKDLQRHEVQAVDEKNSTSYLLIKKNSYSVIDYQKELDSGIIIYRVN